MKYSHLLLFTSVFLLSGCSDIDRSSSDSTDLFDSTNPWYVAGKKAVEQRASYLNDNTQAKNVILFVGDGMGISTVTASRIYAGQLLGLSGEEYQLSFEKLPFTGLSKTYNVDAQTPDSAGTMTAMVTGVKTDAGVIGLSEEAQRGVCHQAEIQMPSALVMAELAGMKTGIVTTARLTHATPAATYAYSAERNWEDISDMTEDAVAAGCVDIASQFVDFKTRTASTYGVAVDGIEVAFGGGRRHFLPADTASNTADARSEIEGDRTDGRHLISEWQKLNPVGQFAFDSETFASLSTLPVLGLFEETHMRFEIDRQNDKAGEPSLSEMTQKALELLQADADEEGFFLMVESGRIDHAHHAGSAFNALHETREFSNAVSMALNMTSEDDTLIIVTADHSHVFTMAGYPKRGNPILGKVVGVGQSEPTLAEDGKPYTTLGYMNGRGHYALGDQTDPEVVYEEPVTFGRQDITDINTQSVGYHQEALVPLTAETHGGEDVAIYARGPGAPLISGVNEQNVIFHVMNHAAGLSQRASERIQLHATQETSH